MWMETGSDRIFYTVVTIVTAIVALAVINLVFRSRRRQKQVNERLQVNPRQKRAATAEEARNRFIENIGRRFADPKSRELNALRHRLMKAGYYSKPAPYIFIGIRFMALLIPQVLLLLLWPLIDQSMPKNGLLMTSVGLAIIGFVAPSFLLDKKVSKREDQYREGFPDMIDLLVACVEAGLSLDGAVQRVSDELAQRYPSLGDHMKILTLETRAGRARAESWKNFADRIGLDEARSLAVMLRQSEELGTSISETLRVFSIEMREKRMLRAEEKALALPAKLVVPLILFVFPSLLTVLLLPAVHRMIGVMAQV